MMMRDIQFQELSRANKRVGEVGMGERLKQYWGCYINPLILVSMILLGICTCCGFGMDLWKMIFGKKDQQQQNYRDDRRGRGRR